MRTADHEHPSSAYCGNDKCSAKTTSGSHFNEFRDLSDLVEEDVPGAFRQFFTLDLTGKKRLNKNFQKIMDEWARRTAIIYIGFLAKDDLDPPTKEQSRRNYDGQHWTTPLLSLDPKRLGPTSCNFTVEWVLRFEMSCAVLVLQRPAGPAMGVRGSLHHTAQYASNVEALDATAFKPYFSSGHISEA